MLIVIYRSSITMVKVASASMDTPESVASVRPLEPQPTTPGQALQSAAQTIQF
jgi:hypothetical protein